MYFMLDIYICRIAAECSELAGNTDWLLFIRLSHAVFVAGINKNLINHSS